MRFTAATRIVHSLISGKPDRLQEGRSRQQVLTGSACSQICKVIYICNDASIEYVPLGTHAQISHAWSADSP